MTQHVDIGAKALRKAQILSLHKAPLHGVESSTVADGSVTVAGVLLAPEGDSSKVWVETDPGVKFSWDYPRAHPGAEAAYWYWPNSARSEFVLRLSLVNSVDENNAFRVRFRFGTPEIKQAAFKDTIYVPKDLRRYQNFPGTSNLERVQYAENLNSVVVRGFSDYRRMRGLAENCGADLTRARILDWGCGHGRVIRHFDDIGPGVELHGVDIDAENADWANNNLRHVNAIHGPLMPPLPYSDEMFDFVFGISVMTHLTNSVQRAWLPELRRITRPGGLVLVTFSGDTDVAYSSRFLNQAYIDDYVSRGRGADLESRDLIGKIADDSYYRNVKISAEAVRRLCAEHFEVLDVLECMFGYQDLAVLRRV